MDEELHQLLLVMEDARQEGNAALPLLGAALAAKLGVSEAGGDAYGLWCRFEIQGTDGATASARMRWCWPGRFTMGSPKKEPGRKDWEGPQHEVVLTRGFWLGEVPVTQALYQAAMKINPSRFASPDRPVERVRWDEAQKLRARLHARVPRLRLRLPTEAEWEYAVRAGTTTPRYGELDDIAWYKGNSAEGFEPGSEGGTHPVGHKLPNAWGLYDMLGNVFEWCLDASSFPPSPYDPAPQRDPLGKTGSRQAVRGGSWRDDARYVRAACREAYRPDFYTHDFLGLRLAGGPAPGGEGPD